MRALQTQKKDVHPEMIAKSLDAPRKSAEAASYPPHIAKFMSRVRNSSTDADDPTQGLGDDQGKSTGPDRTGPTTTASVNDDVFTTPEPPFQQPPAPGRVEAKQTSDEHYRAPKAALGRAISLENANKQLSRDQPLLPNTVARPRSSTVYSGVLSKPPAGTSYSLPRGRYTPPTMHQFSAQFQSRETVPPPVLTHSTDGTDAQGRGGQLQSSFQGVQQPSITHTQNGSIPRAISRPPSIPIRGRASGGDSIPNSPTYFTQHHPHKDEPTPSPETQFINDSFKLHLTSLHPSKGAKSTNISTWMQHSSDYWSSNKSGPFKGPRGVFTASNPPSQLPREQINRSRQTPPIYPTVATIPSSARAPAARPVHQPIVGQPHSLQQLLPVHRRDQVPSSTTAYPTASSGGEPSLFASSVSNTSLHAYRNTSAPLRASQPLPNYPRPHSARTAPTGGNYYVLDV